MSNNVAIPGLDQLVEVKRQVEHWRRTRQSRTAMPLELWRAAAAVARVVGLYATARALRLDYSRLKRRLGGPASQAGKVPAFVEVRVESPSAREPSDFLVELERPDGGRMRARLSTLDALAVLSDSFWGKRS